MKPAGTAFATNAENAAWKSWKMPAAELSTPMKLASILTLKAANAKFSNAALKSTRTVSS